MKYYVLADVHGFCTKLRKTLEEKGYFSDTVPRKLVLLGDFFDRGKEPCAMQEFLLEELAKGNVILVRGNHEDLAEDFCDRLEDYMTPLFYRSAHYYNGTAETMFALSGVTFEEAYTFPKRASNLMRRTPFLREIVPRTVDYFETEHYVFVHGWIPCDTAGDPYDPVRYLPMADWRSAEKAAWELARWHNGMRAHADGVTVPGKTVVCGHVHASYGHAVLEGKGSEYGPDADFSPYRAEGILAIDGCTAASGVMNCVVLED